VAVVLDDVPRHLQLGEVPQPRREGMDFPDRLGHRLSLLCGASACTSPVAGLITPNLPGASRSSPPMTI
jgi:hypothetical protein